MKKINEVLIDDDVTLHHDINSQSHQQEYGTDLQAQ